MYKNNYRIMFIKGSNQGKNVQYFSVLYSNFGIYFSNENVTYLNPIEKLNYIVWFAVHVFKLTIQKLQ